MSKKIQKLTEADLQRYERALQLWEISLRKQEAELEEREEALLLPVGQTAAYFDQKLIDRAVVTDYEASVDPEWLERLGVLRDPRE